MDHPFVTGPFAVQPRLDTKPWGGTRLVQYGFSRPADAAEPLGEVLVSADQSVIAGGPYRGQSLGELTAQYHHEVAGPLGRRLTGGRATFPLLIKLIDAAQNLSIQVHPDDQQARARNSNGKTEAWYILDAPAEGQLYLGLTPDASLTDFLHTCEVGDGRSARFLRQMPAHVGESVVIPAGTVHALGAGVLVYEVQQPSEITYRLDDWGRVGNDGRPRDRHLEDGRRAIKPDLRPALTTGAQWLAGSGQRRLLAACGYFAMERIGLSGDERIVTTTHGSPQVFTAISGEAMIGDGGEAVQAPLGNSVVVPAAMPSVTLACVGQATILRAWIPDLPQEIIAPARRAGISDTTLSAIGISTP